MCKCERVCVLDFYDDESHYRLLFSRERRVFAIAAARGLGQPPIIYFKSIAHEYDCIQLKTKAVMRTNHPCISLKIFSYGILNTLKNVLDLSFV